MEQPEPAPQLGLGDIPPNGLGVMHKDTNYTPNHIPVRERVENIIGSIFFVAYGAYGVWTNDLHLVFGKRSTGIHLHDIAAWLMFAASICGCVVLLTVVVDHYDKRNNETNYKKLADIFKFSGVAFAVLSLLVWALMEIFR